MKKFLAITLIAFLAAIALISLVTTRLRERALAATSRDLAARAQLVALLFDRTLQLRLGEAFTFSTLPSLRAFAASDEIARPARLATAQFELRAIVSADPAIRAASITDATGRVILTTDGSMNADWGNRMFVRKGQIGHPYVSPPLREFSEVSQFYSAPIIDNFGNIGGVLVLRVMGQEIWDALFAAPNTLIVDENGVRIGDTTQLPQLFTAIAPLSNEANASVATDHLYGAEIDQIRVVLFPELVAPLKSRRPAQTVLRDPNGVTYLAAIHPIETNPWSVVMLAREDAFGSANAGYWEAFGWGTLGGVLLAALTYFALK